LLTYPFGSRSGSRRVIVDIGIGSGSYLDIFVALIKNMLSNSTGC